MSERELGRVEVLARVGSEELRLVDAARLMDLSYRQTERVWKRYQEEGATGLKHRSAGRRSNRAYAESFRRKILRRVREKYGGPVGETLWSDPGGGASELRGRAEGGPGDAAAMDAGGRVMEPGAEEAATPAKARAQGTFRRDGADGWELPLLAGGAWPRGLLDGPGRRRHQHHAGTVGEGGDDLGG